MGVLAEDFLDPLLNQRDSNAAADQNDFVDLAGLKPGVLQSRQAGLHGTLHQIRNHALELGAGQFQVQCFGPEASEVMKGMSMVVSIVVDSSHLAFLAASFSR